MPTITFVESDAAVTVEYAPGATVMEVAVLNDISGIPAECGGACSCSTCHVVLDEREQRRFPPADENENSLLDFTASPRHPASRLSCQLHLDASHAGMVFQVPTVTD